MEDAEDEIAEVEVEPEPPEESAPEPVPEPEPEPESNGVLTEAPRETIAHAEGTILRNPTTGERVELRGGKWQKI